MSGDKASLGNIIKFPVSRGGKTSIGTNDKLGKLEIFSEVIKSEELTNEDLNSLYSSIIKAIYFIRDEQDNVYIDIEYN